MELKQLIFLKQNYLVTVEHLLMKKKSFCLFVIFGFHQYVSSEILQPHHVVDDRTVITAPTFIHYTVAVITVRYDMCSNIATQ